MNRQSTKQIIYFVRVRVFLQTKETKSSKEGWEYTLDLGGALNLGVGYTQVMLNTSSNFYKHT